MSNTWITMKHAPISARAHGIIDYALTASLLILPRVLGFSKPVKRIYTAEAIVLLGYIALTDHPTALKPVIPFAVHGKIDPFNVAQFALQTGLKPFRSSKKAMKFNIAFTVIAGLTVALTDWSKKR